MKTISLASLIALIGLVIWGCNPTQTVAPEDDTLTTARLNGDTTGFHCKKNLTKIEITTLPVAITNAISASYAGAAINYAAKDDTGNFLVAITQNSTRKTLLFNADGTFNKELAFREGKGPGGPGGPGRGRDSLTKIEVSALPATVTNYIKANFAGATINVAAKDAVRGYVVMLTTTAGDRKTLLFNLDGTFAQEVVRGLKGGYAPVAVSALPAAITNYVKANYAGGTILIAGKNQSGQFKIVVTTTNKKAFELSFAADGTFVQAKEIKR